MRRTVRGTRQADGPHHLVTRAISNGRLVRVALAAAGWGGFLAALVKCLLTTTHP
jgi:hypothetical protein